MSETLTVLRSLDGAPLRKGISYDPDSNLVTVTKKYRGSDNFSAELKGIDGVASAYAVLSEIAKDKYKAVVIGKPAEGVNLAHMKRDSRTIQEQPRQLIPFDVDSFPLDPELFDKFKDVHDLAGMVRAFFPEEYQTAACVFNVTQSHGSEPDNLRLRLWFWLDTPVTRAGLHALWSESGSIVAVDRSV